MTRTAIFIAVLSMLFLLFLLGQGVMPSSAHDFWISDSHYRSLTYPGEHCCGEGDCFEFEDVRATPNGWWIVELNEVVPYSETQASEDNKFWRCRRSGNGARRCFFAPQPSS